MMLFKWKNFVIALCACVVLNILSASVPAWIAPRVEAGLGDIKIESVKSGILDI